MWFSLISRRFQSPTFFFPFFSSLTHPLLTISTSTLLFQRQQRITIKMSAPATSALANATACGADVYQLPITDAACGAQLSGNMSTVFDDCCKGDAPVKYNNDCGIYCLAQGQTVHELSSCLMSRSNNYSGVFCNNNKPNATATEAATTTKSTSTSTSSGTTTASSTSTNAAVLNTPVSKTGLGVVAMLFCSTLMGVLA